MTYRSLSQLSTSEEKLLRWRANQPLRTIQVSKTGSEPVTVSQAKEQLSIPSSDDAHDVRLTRLISAAREKYEYDTQTSLLTTVFDEIYDRFYNKIRLTRREVASVTSVQYYDSNNTQQTLSTDVYGFDESLAEIRLKSEQRWPDTEGRWDSVTIRYETGYASVPEVAKHAMLLLVAHWFENVDMLLPDNMTGTAAYNSLIAVHQRSTYP